MRGAGWRGRGRAGGGRAPARGRRRRHHAGAGPAGAAQARPYRPRAATRLPGGNPMTISMPGSIAEPTAASAARVPCTIVTGFLGAGKTTLIRHVLANAQGRRLAIIVNEFGDVGIDGEILKGCGDAACPEQNIVELANGGLCCTAADAFVPALDTILGLRPAVEHIVIETSGLALPKPLGQAVHWPSIKSRATADGVVAVG